MPAHQGNGTRGRQVRGRRLPSPEGGNRGVVAQDSVLQPCYGDCKFALAWRLVRTVVDAVKAIGQDMQEKAPDKQVSLTDPDARSMKTRGTGIVGYNRYLPGGKPSISTGEFEWQPMAEGPEFSGYRLERWCLYSS